MPVLDPFFSGVAQTKFELGGHSFPLPVFYQDASAVTAVFAARARAVRRMLPDGALAPALVAPGIAAIAITAFEYRASDIGPYNELAVHVLVTRGRTLPIAGLLRQSRSREFSSFVWQLPVTTEIARVGGVELYGFPKFVANIGFERKDGEVRVTLDADGARILSLTGPTPSGGDPATLRYITYSVRAGRLLETTILVRAPAVVEKIALKSVFLDVEPRREMGAALADAILWKRPLFYQWVPRQLAILHAPHVLE